jgi:hypothetical protein
MHGVGTINNAHSAQIRTHTFLKIFFFFEETKKVTTKDMN